MKIRTKLFINSGLYLGLTVLFAIIFHFHSLEIEKQIALDTTAKQLVAETTDLITVGEEYIVYRYERAIMQWDAKFSSTMEILEKISKAEPTDTIGTNLNLLNESFNMVKSIPKEPIGVDRDESILRQEQIFGQMRVLSREIITDALAISEDASGRVGKFVHASQVTIQVLFAILLLVTTLVSYLMLKSITTPLLNLVKHAELIQGGDLKRKINSREDPGRVNRDEVSKLSYAFESMTQKLIKSIERLESEVVERKRAEAELQKAHDNLETRIAERVRELADTQKLFEAVINQSPIPMAIATPEGDLKIYNEACCEQLGFDDEPSIKPGINLFNIKQPWKDYDSEGNLVPVQELPLALALQGKTTNDLEIKVVRKDGTERWEIVNAAPIYDVAGNLIAGFVAFPDITKRKQAELEHSKLQEQLQQAIKMQAVGTLAGGIAHEFNNLLGVIMGCTDMARDEVPKDSFAKAQLDTVMTASYRVKDLIKQILTFSRQAQQKRVSVTLCPLIKESLKLIQSSIPSSIEVKDNVDSFCDNVFADPTEVQQIIMNLSSNAVWALKEQGVIEITMHQVQLTPQEASSLGISAKNYLKLSFSDSGQGMDEVTKARIFDPFFTLKDVGEGTGMGLSIVYAIMESYRGAISVDSEPDKGSTFQLYFPVTDEAAEDKQEQVEDIPRGKERILLVDDDKTYAEMCEKMISRLGYDVDLELDSIQALETFKTSPDRYDLVISDQVMPGLSGGDFAQKIRSVKPGIPIIICTGYSTQMDEVKADILGINAFAYKPVEKKFIAGLIRNVLDI